MELPKFQCFYFSRCGHARISSNCLTGAVGKFQALKWWLRAVFEVQFRQPRKICSPIICTYITYMNCLLPKKSSLNSHGWIEPIEMTLNRTAFLYSIFFFISCSATQIHTHTHAHTCIHPYIL